MSAVNQVLFAVSELIIWGAGVFVGWTIGRDV
jgi:hypothetical protein